MVGVKWKETCMRKKRKPLTDKQRVRNALRKAWMQSKSRSSRLKLDNYTCQCCDKKLTTSKTKLENEPDKYCDKLNVHHTDGSIDWDKVMESVPDHLRKHSQYLTVPITSFISGCVFRELID